MSIQQYSSRDVPRAYGIWGEVNSALSLNVTIDGSATTLINGQFYGEVSAPGNGAWYDSYSATVTASKSGGDADEKISYTGKKKTFIPAHPEALSYDADGNLLSDGRWSYTWNAENRLVAMETSAAAITAGVAKQKLEYVYDSQGRRIKKARYEWVAAWSGSYWSLDASWNYLYDGWNLIAEVDGSGSLSQSYVWGLDLSGSLQGAGGVGGLLTVTNETAAETYSPWYEGNGNVMGYVDLADGEIVAEYEYSPFGEEIRSTGELADEMPFTFSTKFRDKETELLYYGFRYFDPEMGRWPSRDPLGEEGGLNLYGFVGNDGINAYDYLGLQYAPTPQDCARMLAELLAKVGKLITNYHKYDPIADGKGGFPWRHGGRTGVTRPGGHYDKIKQLQRGIKNDVKYYIDLCRGGNGGCPIGKPVPKGVDGWANKPIPLPVVPRSWITYVTDDQIQIAQYVSWSASGAGAVVIIYATGGTAAPFLAPIFLPAVNP